MVGTLQPLDQKFPVVDAQGRPTEYFTRWAQQKQIDIGDSITLADLEDFLTAHKLAAGHGIILTPDGDLNHSPNISVGNGTGLNFDLLGNIKIADTAVVPGTYGDATHVPAIVVDQQGRITGVTLVAITAGGGGGSIYNPITNVPTIAGFTLQQGVAASAAMANLSNARGVSLTVTGAGAADRNALLEKNTPGATWTMTAVLLPNVLSRNFVTYGLYVKDSTTGRIQCFCFGVSGGANTRRMNWNTLTSFSGASDQAGYGPQMAGPIWAKLVLDATNLTFFASADSETYVQLFQNTKFSWPAAIDRCGVWLGINQQNVPSGMSEALSVLSFNVA